MQNKPPIRTQIPVKLIDLYTGKEVFFHYKENVCIICNISKRKLTEVLAKKRPFIFQNNLGHTCVLGYYNFDWVIAFPDIIDKEDFNPNDFLNPYYIYLRTRHKIANFFDITDEVTIKRLHTIKRGGISTYRWHNPIDDKYYWVYRSPKRRMAGVTWIDKRKDGKEDAYDEEDETENEVES